MSDDLVPRDYQEQAIKSILSELDISDRCHAVMACGSGKTLVSLWVCERSKSKTILVLIPTIQLISQTLKEWESNTKWSYYRYIVICSDKTIVDGVNIDIKKEYDISVTTRLEDIRYFLANEPCNKDYKTIIFSTYASSDVLCSAAKGIKFNMAIFDEAHKLAGSSNSERHFSKCIYDKNIRIDKRVFVTATPRHSKISDKQKETFVYSMDDESLFGKRAFTLSLDDAIHKNIVTDYKVVIPIYSDGDVNADSRTSAFVKSISESGSKKILVFHNTIQQSIDFVDDIKASNILNSFVIKHIDGSMTAYERNQILDNYKNNKNVIISNAKCLTEGINVPSIDMVVFYNNKNSVVDIVQAVGRAIRKSPGKKFGYICVPLVSKLSETNYGIIYNILKTMSEVDKDMFEYIKKKNKYGNTLYLDEKIIFMDALETKSKALFNDLTSAIQIKISERTGAKWNKLYEEYVLHIKSGDKNYKNRAIKLWVDKTRSLYKRGYLSKNRIDLLDKIGFNFNPQVDIVKKYISQLQELYDSNKTFLENINLFYKTNRSLYVWINKKICEGKKGVLNKKIERVFVECGVQLENNFLQSKWMLNYNKLLKGIKGDKSLNNWKVHQIDMYRLNKLSKEKIKMLKSANFKFSQKSDLFGTHHNLVMIEKNIDRFKRFIFYNKSRKINKKNPIVRWYNGYKELFNSGKMPTDVIHFFKKREIYFDIEIKGIRDRK